jgi:hypothetical protein
MYKWEDKLDGKKWRKKWFKSTNKKLDKSKMNKDEKIKYLEAEVVYLKELYKEKHWFYP